MEHMVEDCLGKGFTLAFPFVLHLSSLMVQVRPLPLARIAYHPQRPFWQIL